MKSQVCPFCSSRVSLVDSAKLYHRSYGLSTCATEHQNLGDVSRQAVAVAQLTRYGSEGFSLAVKRNDTSVLEQHFYL